MAKRALRLHEGNYCVAYDDESEPDFVDTMEQARTNAKEHASRYREAAYIYKAVACFLPQEPAEHPIIVKD